MLSQQGQRRALHHVFVAGRMSRDSALGGPSLLRVLHRGEMGRLLNISVRAVLARATGKILIAQRQTRYFARNGCNVGSGGCKSIPVSFKDYLVW